MSNTRSLDGEAGQSMTYQIRIKGHLSRQWTDQFAGFSITHENNGDTLLTGPVVDQAELYGILRKVRDLGVLLLSVHSIGDDAS
jgi:hypothetical protein